MTHERRYLEVGPGAVKPELWRAVHAARDFAADDLGLPALRYRFFKANERTSETSISYLGKIDGLFRAADGQQVWLRSDLSPRQGQSVLLHESRHVYARRQGWEQILPERDADAYAEQALGALDLWMRGDKVSAKLRTSKACLAPLPEPRTYTPPPARPKAAPPRPVPTTTRAGAGPAGAGCQWFSPSETALLRAWVNVRLQGAAEEGKRC